VLVQRGAATGLGDRDRLQMSFNSLNERGSEREIRLLGAPMLMEQSDGFTGGIEDQLFRQLGFGGQMREIVFGECIKALGAAAAERRLAIVNVRDCRYKIIEGN